MTVRLGADSTTSNVSALRSLGATFICRYTSEQSWALTLSEAQTLSNAGIDIVSNYEHYAADEAGGYAQGVKNAQTAMRVHKACGGPDDRPIYFSIDHDVSPSDSNLHNYFLGINSVLPVSRVGVYAGTGVCNALKSAGLVQWTWRCMSTGYIGGIGTPSMFNCEQTGYFNSTYDRDASITDDFGQWRVGQNTGGGGGGTTGGLPVVSVSIVDMCAREDPSAPQGSTTNWANVYPVERALNAEGLLDQQYVDGSFGTMTIAAYKAWQVSLGYSGSDADGIPGMTSLTKLAQKHPYFTVTA